MTEEFTIKCKTIMGPWYLTEEYMSDAPIALQKAKMRMIEETVENAFGIHRPNTDTGEKGQ